MKLASDLQFSFARGMMGGSRPGTTPADACKLLVNGRPMMDGTGVKRREGTLRWLGTALNSGAQFWGATEYVSAAGVRRSVMFVGDRAYTLDMTDPLGSATQIATGLATGWWSIVQMRVGAVNYLFACNGGASIYSWDGTTWTTLSGGAPSGAKYLTVHGDRLWAAGHSGDTVVACKVADPNTWATTSGGISLRVITHSGDVGISGLYALGTVVLAFKQNSINFIEGYGYRTLQVEADARGLSRSIGCVSFRSIQGVGADGVAFLSQRGLEYLRLGAAPELVTASIQDFMDKVNVHLLQHTNPGLPCSLWWPEKREYWLALPVGTTAFSSHNNYILHWRPATETSPHALWLQRHGTLADGSFPEDTASPTYTVTTRSWAALWMIELSMVSSGIGLIGESTAAYGAFDGHVRQYGAALDKDNSDLGIGGDAVEMRIVTRPMLFKAPRNRKRARVISVHGGRTAGTTAVFARVQADGTSQTEKTLSLPAMASADTPQEDTTRVAGKGRDLRVHVRTQQALAVISAVGLDAEVLREPT